MARLAFHAAVIIRMTVISDARGKVDRKLEQLQIIVQSISIYETSDTRSVGPPNRSADNLMSRRTATGTATRRADINRKYRRHLGPSQVGTV